MNEVVHYDSNGTPPTNHVITFPQSRKRCECWLKFGRVTDYYSGILGEVFPELEDLSEEEIGRLLRSRKL